MRPTCLITIDGRPASGLFMERLVACTVTDKEGIAADEVEIELADSPPGDVPKKGAVISVDMGYSGAMAFMGEFIAQEVELTMLPGTMRVTGKSSGFGKGAGRKERHWDDITLGDLVKEIAGDNGLASSVDPDIGAFVYDWIGQNDESDIAFLDRLAQRHDALFSIKKQTVIFAKRGQGKSPSGKDLTEVLLTPSIIRPGSARVTFSEREKYKEVIAAYMDRGAGARKEVKVPSDPEGDGDYTFDQPFASEAEAKKAAEAKAKELQRRAVTFEVEIIGNPGVRGGAPVVFSGVRPAVDGIKFLAETATHKFTATGGYTTSISGKQKI